MKEYIVQTGDNGRRLDKYISGILKNAPSSFCHKMLRKKNIVLNGKKAEGGEIIKSGDTIRFYLSDETFERFSKRSNEDNGYAGMMPPIIHEDGDVLIVNKPAGMLSQRSTKQDISLNEICLSYLSDKGSIDDESLKTFTPSICNRLDRNTSGLITFAKTYHGARCLSEAFRNRNVHKYYLCIVTGHIDKDMDITGSLLKDEAENKVYIGDEGDKGSFIHTAIRPVSYSKDLTMLEVHLITGKTHQIRAHLAHLGHPIIGDGKYGNREINEIYRNRYGVLSQLLACVRLEFDPGLNLSELAGKTITIDPPGIFDKVM